jgi:hypothetical protein
MLRLMPVALDKAGVLRTLTRRLRRLQLLLHPLHRPPPLLARPQRPRTLSTRPRVPRASGNSLEMQVFVPLTLPILFAHYNLMQTQVPLLISHPIATGFAIMPPDAFQSRLLHPAMVLWVLGHRDGALVVNPKDGWCSGWESNLHQQISHPADLLASRHCSNVFCFSGGQCVSCC